VSSKPKKPPITYYVTYQQWFGMEYSPRTYGFFATEEGPIAREVVEKWTQAIRIKDCIIIDWKTLEPSGG